MQLAASTTVDRSSSVAGTMAPHTILAHDVFVRERDPVGAALGTVLTLGLLGAITHNKVSNELRRYGRNRGRMPFPFLVVDAGRSTLGWVAGLLGWAIVVFACWDYASRLLDGRSPQTGDITTSASLALLLAPLLLVTVGTVQRIRTAQHMAGIDGPFADPRHGALLAIAFPPLGTWYVQRELNRVWETYR